MEIVVMNNDAKNKVIAKKLNIFSRNSVLVIRRTPKI